MQTKKHGSLRAGIAATLVVVSLATFFPLKRADAESSPIKDKSEFFYNLDGKKSDLKQKGFFCDEMGLSLRLFTLRISGVKISPLATCSFGSDERYGTHQDEGTSFKRYGGTLKVDFGNSVLSVGARANTIELTNHGMFDFTKPDEAVTDVDAGAELAISSPGKGILRSTTVGAEFHNLNERVLPRNEAYSVSFSFPAGLISGVFFETGPSNTGAWCGIHPFPNNPSEFTVGYEFSPKSLYASLTAGDKDISVKASLKSENGNPGVSLSASVTPLGPFKIIWACLKGFFEGVSEAAGDIPQDE